MQTFFLESPQKVSKMDVKVTSQFFPFFSKKKQNSHLCQGKCSDTKCGEPPAMNNQNTRYNINIGAQKRFY